MGKISAAEVKKHTSKEAGLWLVIEGSVYDITEWAPDHPGGPKVISAQAGKDATDKFHKFHPEYVLQKVAPKYKIGDLEDQAKL